MNEPRQYIKYYLNLNKIWPVDQNGKIIFTFHSFSLINPMDASKDVLKKSLHDIQCLDLIVLNHLVSVHFTKHNKAIQICQSRWLFSIFVCYFKQNQSLFLSETNRTERTNSSAQRTCREKCISNEEPLNKMSSIVSCFILYLQRNTLFFVSFN